MRILLVLLTLMFAAPTPAADAAGDVRGILSEQAPNWYDRGADDWRQVEVKDRREDDEDRDRSGGGGDGVEGGVELFAVLLYAAIFAALIGLVAWLVLNASDVVEVDLGRSSAPLRPTAALSDLPFDVADTGDPEAALAKALADGDLRAALIWLYACLLLRLDALGRLRLARSKTNRCYLRELPRDDAVHPLLERTVLAFEAMYFGGRPVERADLDRLHAGYRRFADGGGA